MEKSITKSVQFKIFLQSLSDDDAGLMWEFLDDVQLEGATHDVTNQAINEIMESHVSLTCELCGLESDEEPNNIVMTARRKTEEWVKQYLTHYDV